MVEVPDILEEEDATPPSTEAEISSLSDKISRIENRCKLAGIEFRQLDQPVYTGLSISLSSEIPERNIHVFTEERADLILSIEFEKFNLVPGYEAIFNSEDGTIECRLRTTSLSSSFLLKRIIYFDDSNPAPDMDHILILPPDHLPGRPTIEIGPCSNQFRALCVFSGPPVITTIRLSGVRATQVDRAASELRSFSDSLFFQIDVLHGSTFILERARRPPLFGASIKNRKDKLEYPTAQYNDDAMSLYWYAKSARAMPLLRFLAFYQSIEYYFPRYSQIETRKRVSSIIKDPAFRIHRDDDLDRMISVIQSSRSGGLGSEREQLRSVVNECLSADDVRRHISRTPATIEHFSGKKSKYRKIPINNNNKSLDLRNDVADRIYDIRCKIVHTKNEHSDDSLPMILPFSEDADYLMTDISLIEFIARGVLISSSGELG